VTAVQHSSLSITRSSSSAQQLLGFTETELSLQKQRAASASTAAGCLSTIPTGTTCAVAWTPCTLSGNSLSCTASAQDPIAYHVRVTTTGPGDAGLELWALAVKGE
jgi:hypothetical protein